MTPKICRISLPAVMAILFSSIAAEANRSPARFQSKPGMQSKFEILSAARSADFEDYLAKVEASVKLVHGQARFSAYGKERNCDVDFSCPARRCAPCKCQHSNPYQALGHSTEPQSIRSVTRHHLSICHPACCLDISNLGWFSTTIFPSISPQVIPIPLIPKL
jgi:hypothetical protein